MFGHWLLVILSTYLKPLTSLDYNWPYLADLLHTLEWENDEIWELLYGHQLKPSFIQISKRSKKILKIQILAGVD